jgi:hypothetical protein
VTIDDQSAVLHTSPFAAGMFPSGPLTQPPPPTGSLAPPPAPELPADDERPAGASQHAVADAAAETTAAETTVAETPAEPAVAETATEAETSDGAWPVLGLHLSDGLRTEMLALLGRSGGQLRAVFDAYRSGTTTPAAIVAAGAVATEDVAAELVLCIRTVLGEPWTASPGRARTVAGTVRTLLRVPDLSREARRHLTDLRGQLLDAAESELGKAQEQQRLDANSVVLQRELRTVHGVSVHTYPHYWRHPSQPDTNRRMVKIATMSHGGWQQVLDQAKAAGNPEEPVLLRVYVATDPPAAEQAFRRLLDAADHVRNGNGGDWYVTSLEFLDEIARALALDIKAGAGPIR